MEFPTHLELMNPLLRAMRSLILQTTSDHRQSIEIKERLEISNRWHF